MPSIWRKNSDGYFAYHDPSGDLTYAVTCWIEDRSFASVTWTITDTGSPSPSLTAQQINNVAVTVDDVEYAAGQLASVKVGGVTVVGSTYQLRARAVFDNGDIDARSFRLICRNQ